MIAMIITWYDRKPDLEPDYCKPHNYEITGATPEICMARYGVLREHHDLVRYTRTEIASIRTK